MNIARVAFVALIALSVSAGATAQWKWRDRAGALHYSDLPPPAGTPDRDVLERPPAPERRIATPPPPAASAAASAPRGLEPELEALRAKAEIEKAEKAQKERAARQADSERMAALRADNCRRAQATMRTLEDGGRVVRTNEKGEREVFDDKMRADEMSRTRTIIASDCAPR